MPASPFTAIAFGPDGGAFTLVGAANPLPVTANAGTGTYVVGGAAAAGAPPSGNAVLVGGYDGTNVQNVKTNSSGNVLQGPAASTGQLKFTQKGQQKTATAIKASAGTLYAVIFTNNSASVQFGQLYDVAAASVTAGTSTALLQVAIPPNTSVVISLPQGWIFGTALAVTATTLMDGTVDAGASTVDVYVLYL